MSSRALEVPEFKLREFTVGEPHQFVWNRWFEIRFTHFDAFVTAAFAAFGALSERWGVEAYMDLVSTIHLERPDWTLRDLVPYP